MRKRLRLKRSREGLHHWQSLYRSSYPKRDHLHQSAPLFHRAFKRWLNENQDRLGVRLVITGRQRDKLLLRFLGYPDCLSISVSPAEISVAVSLEGQFVDYLLCLDMSSPVMKDGAVFCDSCQPEGRALYPSLDAYWRGHQFEAFGDWLITSFVPAKWLGIYQNCAVISVHEPDREELLQAIPLTRPGDTP